MVLALLLKEIEQNLPALHKGDNTTELFMK